MESLLPFLFIAVFIVLAIVGAYFAYQAQQKRREDLGRLAAGLGWRFDTQYDYLHDNTFPQFGIFQQGLSRYAYNTLSGSTEIAGRPLTAKMGDFHYETRSTDSKGRTTTHTHLFSYLIVQLPWPGVPGLTIRREHIFDKLGGFFGFDDIDFESQEFSSKFMVKSGDKRFAYDVVYPRMMEFLMASDPPALQIADGYCCLGTGSGCWKVEDFGRRLEWAREFFELWPHHVTTQLES